MKQVDRSLILLENVEDFQWQAAGQILMPASRLLLGTNGGLADADLYSSGNLVFDFANGTGDNGLDTGAEAGSQWYALYAVPGVGSAYKLKATIRHPITQPGPTGFTKWRYLGVFRNGEIHNANQTDILQFTKIGPIVQMFALANTIANGIRYESLGAVTSANVTTTLVFAMNGGKSIPFDRARYLWSSAAIAATPSTAEVSLVTKYNLTSVGAEGYLAINHDNGSTSNVATVDQKWMTFSQAALTLITQSTNALATGTFSWSLNLAGYEDPLLLKQVKNR